MLGENCAEVSELIYLDEQEGKDLYSAFKFLDFWYEFIFTRGLEFWNTQHENIDIHYNRMRLLQNKIWEAKDAEN